MPTQFHADASSEDSLGNIADDICQAEAFLLDGEIKDCP